MSRHAYKHFEETQHTYAMQLTNHRVWDYAGGKRPVLPSGRVTLFVKRLSGPLRKSACRRVCSEIKGFVSVLIPCLLGTSISSLIAVFVGPEQMEEGERDSVTNRGGPAGSVESACYSLSIHLP